MVVKQYPDVVIIKTSNWSNNTSSNIVYPGRREGGASARRDFFDPMGSVTYVVYMPLPVSEIQIGTPVEVTRDGVLKVADTVKQFSKDQMNARIWL